MADFVESNIILAAIEGDQDRVGDLLRQMFTNERRELYEACDLVQEEIEKILPSHLPPINRVLVALDEIWRCQAETKKGSRCHYTWKEMVNGKRLCKLHSGTK